MSKESEPLNIANKILEKIEELEKLKKAYIKVISETIKADAEYDRALAVTMMKMRNGVELELDGEKIKDPQAGLIEKMSRGICWQEKLAVETSHGRLDGIKSNIQCCLAQLNGFQSINRHLSDL